MAMGGAEQGLRWSAAVDVVATQGRATLRRRGGIVACC